MYHQIYEAPFVLLISVLYFSNNWGDGLDLFHNYNNCPFDQDIYCTGTVA